jgi:hypothetical protein
VLVCPNRETLDLVLMRSLETELQHGWIERDQDSPYDGSAADYEKKRIKIYQVNETPQGEAGRKHKEVMTHAAPTPPSTTYKYDCRSCCCCCCCCCCYCCYCCCYAADIATAAAAAAVLLLSLLLLPLLLSPLTHSHSLGPQRMQRLESANGALGGQILDRYQRQSFQIKWLNFKKEMVDWVRAQLVKLYEVQNPSKVADVDQLLLQWRGREREVLAVALRKYGGGGGWQAITSDRLLANGAAMAAARRKTGGLQWGDLSWES